MKCGRLATYSFRMADSEKQVLLGEKQEYMPLCRTCYMEEIKKQ